MKYLLDTSAVLEFIQPQPNAGVVRWMGGRDEGGLFLSVLTLGEIHKAIARLPSGARKERLFDWVDEDLARRFYGRVLPVDEEIAAEWGRIQASGLERGEPVPVVDGLIAATALVHHLTVVTRNAAGISRCGAAVLDPAAA